MNRGIASVPECPTRKRTAECEVDIDEKKKKNAKALKKSVEAMGEEAKAAWYKNQRQKRLEEDVFSRRTWAEPKAAIEETKGSSKIDDVDHWLGFEDFALRKIQLKQCSDLEGATPLWAEACSAPGAVTRIGRNNAVLLGHYCGMQSRSRHEEGMTATINQSGEIKNAEDLSEFEKNGGCACTV